MNQDERRAMRILCEKDPQFDEKNFRQWCEHDLAHKDAKPEQIAKLYIEGTCLTRTWTT